MFKRLSRHYRFVFQYSVLITAFFVWIALISIQARPAHAREKRTRVVDLSTAISRVAKRNVAAVVHIEVIERHQVPIPYAPFQNDPFFQYFFDIPRMPGKFKKELKGIGTGMIMDSQGHILTNHHVVAGATKMQVLLSSGARYPAKVLGTDPKTDLAVIQIPAEEPLPHVSFGDSDRVEVGEWVVAIGRPRGLNQTVTKGIISAQHRLGITNPSSYQDFLQTDATINPGNSGGPLLNLQSEVIGINVATVCRSGGFEGIGFAIPSNMALHITTALIAHGKVERGWLGVKAHDLTLQQAKSFGMEDSIGALIADVIEGGPAEMAGMKKGDVVIAYHGKEIPDAATLQNEVSSTPIGRETNVTILRKGKKQDITVRIGNLEGTNKMVATSIRDRLGAEIRPVTSKEAAKYNLGVKHGVSIFWLAPTGPFGRVGFEVGDIILEINGQPIKSLSGFVDLMDSLRPPQRITLLALDHRTGQTGYVQILVR